MKAMYETSIMSLELHCPPSQIKAEKNKDMEAIRVVHNARQARRKQEDDRS